MIETDKMVVEAQCPACMGSGRTVEHEESRKMVGAQVLWVGGDSVLCKGCFGTGKIDVAVEEECEDAIWDEALSTLEMVGVDRHDEAYAYRWRNGEWAVVTYEQAQMGGIQ